MTPLMLILFACFGLSWAAPIRLADNRQLQLQHPLAERDRFEAQHGTETTSSTRLPLLPMRPDSTPKTTVDIGAELRRLGLEHLDLQHWSTADDDPDAGRYFRKLLVLSPASSYRAKARALACLASGSDRPPRSLIWEYEWSIFYNEFRHASAVDERTRELVEYYHDQLKREQVRTSIQERAAAIASLVSLTATPSRLLVQRLEREVPRDIEAYVSSAREWASGVVAGYLSPIHAAWNTVARYYSAVRER